jgi:valyl-tRNA synthetase
MVNWCPATHTAISDEEVNMKPQQGFFYKMRYELVEPMGSARIWKFHDPRPETLMGDTAVAVHPEDERYKHLIGKTGLAAFSAGGDSNYRGCLRGSRVWDGLPEGDAGARQERL